jgi:hypothetical protein
LKDISVSIVSGGAEERRSGEESEDLPDLSD